LLQEIEMIRTTVIANEQMSLNAVYRFENFLEEDYLNLLTEKTEELTLTDFQQRKTNVKANMTEYDKLLYVEEYQHFIQKSIQFLDFIMRIRGGTREGWEYIMDDFWGMRHQKGDNTIRHRHLPAHWSGSFYLKVPGDTKMYFPEFDFVDTLKENTLYLFPAFVDHLTSIQDYEENRISIAFNISLNKIS